MITFSDIKRKIHTLRINPKQSIRIAASNFVLKLRDACPSCENYDEHWNFTSFNNRTVLDIGADVGSTVEYFLNKGAVRVIAVEGDKNLARKLCRNYRKSRNVICINCFITTGLDIAVLIAKYQPDIVKIDV